MAERDESMMSRSSQPWSVKLAYWVKNALPIAVLGLIGWLGETGADGGLIKDVWAAAKTASPFAAMFAILAWLDEKRERREAQAQCNDRTIDFIKSTNAASSAFEKMAAGLGAVRGKRSRNR